MRIDVGAKFVTAEKNVAAEERVTFAFEVQILRQPDDFIAVLFHPTREMRRFSAAFFVPEIARNKTAADGQAGVRGEDHVGKFRARWDELDLAIECGKRVEEAFPLRLDKRRIGAAGAAHPGIDLVLDAVIIRRTEEQLAHTSK